MCETKLNGIKKQKRDILKASAALFHHKGYNATTLQEIAKEVNMEAPSLYNHIQSKQAILADLLLTVAKEFVKGIDIIESANLTTTRKLEKVVQLHIELSFEFRNTSSLMLAEYVHLIPDDKKRYLALKSEYEAKFKNIINECIAAGDLDNQHTDLMIFTLLSTLRSIYAWIGKHPNINKIELESQLSKFLLKGILRDHVQTIVK